MESKDFKDVIRVMTKEEFESTIEEDIKFVEGFKNFLKHDDATRIVEHIKSVLEASVDYYYPNHPEVEFEKDDVVVIPDYLKNLPGFREVTNDPQYFNCNLI